MKIHRDISRAELAAIVCEALAELGDEPVLVGGAVAAIYTEGRYVSDDLDFVSWRNERQFKPILERLGFSKSGMHWSHPDTPLLLQFVNSPVMVGKKHVKHAAELSTALGNLRILSPLDCALDRFSWYLNRGDQQTLMQTVDVIVTQGVALSDIEMWLANEDYPSTLKKRALEALNREVKKSRR